MEDVAEEILHIIFMICIGDLSSKIFNTPSTLADIGISEQRKELAMQAIAQVWTTGTCSVAQTPEVMRLRQQGEEQQSLERARERVERAVKDRKILRIR